MNYANPLYKHIASAVGARLNCLASEENTGKPHDWTQKHEETISNLVDDFMPSGSGIDSGTKIDLDLSTSEKLVFTFSFHHMDENGYYSGWTDHVLTVKPSLQFDIDLKISGPNKNDIKEYLHDIYHNSLTETIDWDEEKKCYFSPSMRLYFPFKKEKQCD